MIEFIIENRLVIYIILYIIGGLTFAYFQTYAIVQSEGWWYDSKKLTIGSVLVVFFLLWPIILLFIAVAILLERLGGLFIKIHTGKQRGDKIHV